MTGQRNLRGKGENFLPDTGLSDHDMLAKRAIVESEMDRLVVESET